MGKKYYFLSFFFIFSINVSAGGGAANGPTWIRKTPANQQVLQAPSSVADNSFDSKKQKLINHTSSAQTPDGKTCDIAFKSLKYVGEPFQGSAICVDASNDRVANLMCSQTKYKRAVNPGNKQYGQDNGPRDSNSLGYYYCVEARKENNKEHICKVEAKRRNPKYKFDWTGENGRDGDCLCNVNDGSNKRPTVACEAEVPPYISTCTPEKGLEPSGSTLTANDGFMTFCKCAGSDNYYPEYTAEQDCKKLVTAEKEAANEKTDKLNAFSKESTTPPETPQETPPEPPTINNAFQNCVDNYVQKSEACKTTSEEAKKSCVPDEKQMKEDKETASAIHASNKLYTQIRGTGASAQQDCFAASLVANAAVGSLDKMKASCDTNIEVCTDKCSEDVVKNFIAQCIPGKHETLNNTTPGPNLAYYNEKKAIIEANIQAGTKDCTEVAKAGELTLSGMLEGVGNSLQSSLKCMCKLSSGNTGDCNAIPTISICNTNPSSPGCGVWGALDVCTPGNTYDAKLCGCQTNPKTAGCPAYASGGLSNFASPTLKNPTGSAGSNIGLAGGLKVGSDDIAMPTSDEDTGVTPKLDFPGGGPSAGGPGGGGGGLGGAGGGSGGAPAAEGAVVPEEKGLSGLFNLAKSYISGAFGKKKFDNGNLKNGKPVNTGADVNKFRPMRGVASKNGSGTKNQDIWLRMNRCFVAETCQGNNNNFLDSALKQK